MNEQLLDTLKTYLDPDKTWTEAEEKQLAVLLRFSGSKILNQRYPFDDSVSEVPVKYEMTQVRIAAELYAKMGAEGQTSHGENGIIRAWESADVAQGLLDEIIPLAGVI